ncbi:hypothetical protein PCASD_04732 [Puccinia coronata f. sp. avenae]|nr:hypothetical protein PCASD_04732 [Puccinia coronata f. sp. avenae]
MVNGAGCPSTPHPTSSSQSIPGSSYLLPHFFLPIFDISYPTPKLTKVRKSKPVCTSPSAAQDYHSLQ